MYDVIVLGAGTAGIPCVLEASRPNSTGDGIMIGREIGSAIAPPAPYRRGAPGPFGRRFRFSGVDERYSIESAQI